MKRINAENIRLTILIFLAWFRSIFLVVFRHPQNYLPDLTRNELTNKQLSEKDWKLVKKVIRGTHRISPLFLKKRRCLMESLIVYRVLMKLGIDSGFLIGVKKEGTKIETHAWIEINKKVIIGGAVNGYKKLIRIR